MAFTTAVVEIVAPETASISSSATGIDLPMNWSVKAASVVSLPRPSVSSGALTVSVPILRLSSMVTSAVMVPPNPWASPTSVAPAVMADGSASAACLVSLLPNTTSPPLAERTVSAKEPKAALTSPSTAFEVKVAPERASNALFSAAFMPMNCSANLESRAREPIPVVS